MGVGQIDGFQVHPGDPILGAGKLGFLQRPQTCVNSLCGNVPDRLFSGPSWGTPHSRSWKTKLYARVPNLCKFFMWEWARSTVFWSILKDPHSKSWKTWIFARGGTRSAAHLTCVLPGTGHWEHLRLLPIAQPDRTKKPYRDSTIEPKLRRLGSGAEVSASGRQSDCKKP